MSMKANYKHGEYNTRLYSIWRNMKIRCYLAKSTSYKYYGGRGISVCEEWRNSFINFRDWAVENGYNETLTLDRVNNFGNYMPDEQL